MNTREADIIHALMLNLDGSQPLDAADLMTDVEWLIDAAGVALGGVLPVDLDMVACTLGEVEQRFADGGAL